MNKGELVDAIATDANLSKTDAESALERVHQFGAVRDHCGRKGDTPGLRDVFTGIAQGEDGYGSSYA